MTSKVLLDNNKRKKETIISYYNEGYGCRIISQRLCISERHVSRVINRYLEHGDVSLVKFPYQYYTDEFKIDIVMQVLNKCLSCEQVALRYGVGISTLELWVRKVKQGGYDSLIASYPRGQPPKDMERPKKKKPQTELEILREQNERLQTEIALLKKVRALVEAREARLSEIGQKPSNG